MFTSINPATEETIGSYLGHSTQEVLHIIENATAGFETWKTKPLSKRLEAIASIASILRESKNALALKITEEMGKPILQSYYEVEKCAAACDYYANQGQSLLCPEKIVMEHLESTIHFDPIGTVLAIMPWNFPLWQIFRCLLPCLLVGNTLIVKHAPNVCGVAIALEQLMNKAKLPQGLYQTLFVLPESIETIISDPRIAAVTLTGSEKAGSSVAAISGKYLKKTVLELGGSDPFIILKDADLTVALQAALEARLINNGQSCIAAKRFIIEKEIFQEFAKGLKKAVGEIKIGDPKDPATHLGPLARYDLLEKLDQQVKKSIDFGATCLAGAYRVNRKGFYYAPTILTDLKKGMPAYEEELFGPVFSLFEASSKEEAIAIANDTAFGLGASLWTSDLEQGKMIASRIQAGSVFINEKVYSDARLPFGGIKRSGYGRELSHYGLKEFVNIKTIAVKKPQTSKAS